MPIKRILASLQEPSRKIEDIASAMVSGQYCIDAVVAVVHKDNPLEDITQAQLKDIFTGKITNWEDLNK